MSTEGIEAALDRVLLVDHHVHGALRRGPEDRDSLEGLITESDRPVPAWMTQFDSQVGFAVRRWCAPLLDLDPMVGADEYVARRMEIGETEVTRRLLRASGVGSYLVETGHGPSHLLGPSEMAEASGRTAHEVVRLERVLEDMAQQGLGAEETVLRFREVLAERTAEAVGLKSIVAYRHGFDFRPARPDRHDVVAAMGSWLHEVERTGVARVVDEVLLRFVLWAGVDRGLPLQLHSGYGDPDLTLNRCDPLLLTDFIRLVEPRGVDLVLLHCYPYHRHAGYLAQMFPHVYFDIGLGVPFAGARSTALVAESLELAPFAKVLFSSDAWGPAELHYLGALLWRRGMSATLGGWVAAGDWSLPDAERVATMIGRDNARRVYALTELEA